MAIAHRNTQTAATTASGPANDTVTITKPTGLAVDDYMVHWLMANNNEGAGSWDTPTPPSGFGSALAEIAATGAWNKIWVYGKVATAGDVAASNFSSEYTNGATGPYCVLGGISAYSGVDTTNPTDGVTPTTSYTGGNTSTNCIAPSITPANADPKLLVCVFAVTDGNLNSESRTITVPGSMTQRGQQMGFATTAYARIAMADEAYASASPTGTRTGTHAGADASQLMITLLLREASAITIPLMGQISI